MLEIKLISEIIMSPSKSQNFERSTTQSILWINDKPKTLYHFTPWQRGRLREYGANVPYLKDNSKKWKKKFFAGNRKPR